MDSEILGYVLLAAAVALFLAELLLPTGGLIGLVGVAALVAGQIILDVPWWVIVLVVLAILAFGAFLTQKVYAAHKQDRILTGWEEMIGAEGEVRVALEPVGQMFVNGALWRAKVASGSGPLPVGARARVREIDGLTLHVEPL